MGVDSRKQTIGANIPREAAGRSEVYLWCERRRGGALRTATPYTYNNRGRMVVTQIIYRIG